MVLPALMHLMALVETVDGVGLGDAFSLYSGSMFSSLQALESLRLLYLPT